jgi:hypothetical protein
METWRSGQVWLLNIYIFDALVRSPICSIRKPNQDWCYDFAQLLRQNVDKCSCLHDLCKILREPGQDFEAQPAIEKLGDYDS